MSSLGKKEEGNKNQMQFVFIRTFLFVFFVGMELNFLFSFPLVYEIYLNWTEIEKK